VRDSTGRTIFSYDVMGQVAVVDKYIGITRYTTKADYDDFGRVRKITYPDNTEILYQYNGPYLERVHDGTRTYVSYGDYNSQGQPAAVRYGNGVSTFYTYSNSQNPECREDNYRLCTMTTFAPSGLDFLKYRYSYDAVGNVTAIGDQQNSSQIFVYDAQDRLLASGRINIPSGSAAPRVVMPPTAGLSREQVEAALNALGNNAVWESKYEYNEIGNITYNSRVGEYRYGPSGPSSTRPHAVTNTVVASGTISFTYDANGSLVNGGGRSYIYDYENRPVYINTSGTSTSCSYDWSGDRVEKTGGNETVKYIGDIYECKAGGACVRHIFAGGERIAQIPSNSDEARYYHADYLGSSRAITNRLGAIFRTFSYQPFGLMSGSTQPQSEISYLFTGGEYDRSSGLYFLGARLYDPILGRFLSPDSIVPYPLNPQSLNRYSYALNNPSNYTDSNGYYAASASDGGGDGCGRCGDGSDIETGWDFEPHETNPRDPDLAGGRPGNEFGPFDRPDPPEPPEREAPEIGDSGEVSDRDNNERDIDRYHEPREREPRDRDYNGGAVRGSSPGPSLQERLEMDTPIQPTMSPIDLIVGGGAFVLTKIGFRTIVPIIGVAIRRGGRAARSLDNPASLRGASKRQVERLIPKGWTAGPSKRGGGVRYANPSKPGEQVRVMPGNPRDPNPIKQGPYGRISKGGKVSDPIPLKGNKTLP
jgi:RHS repeat-associated protein